MEKAEYVAVGKNIFTTFPGPLTSNSYLYNKHVKNWFIKKSMRMVQFESGPDGEFFSKETRDMAAKGPGEKSHGAARHLSARRAAMTEGLTLQGRWWPCWSCGKAG